MKRTSTTFKVLLSLGIVMFGGVALSSCAAAPAAGSSSTTQSAAPPADPAAFTSGTTVTIKDVGTGLCVDTGGSTGFSLLLQAKCSGVSSQNFTLQNAPTSGYYYLVGSASNLCWDVQGGSTSAGALIQQYTCAASGAEYYKLSSVGPANYKIYSGNMANGCIDAKGTSNIEQNNCKGSKSQQFLLSVVANPVSVSISPTTATVSSGGTQQFTATVSGTSNTAVTWSATAGSVSSTGLFAAPTVTSNTTVTVTATSQANTSAFASATVTVTAPSTITVSISPTTATVSSGGTQQFTATVSGTSNTAVTWSATAGSVSSTGLFTAPTVTLVTTVTVTASSQANTSKFASATVTVTLSGLTVNVTTFGATGNGTTDDTAAINAAIATLVSGDTLLFPCGTYLTSAQLFINVSNVTVDGSGCATIHNASSGSAGIIEIGGAGNGNPNYGSPVSLAVTANELATSFTTASSLGVNPGDYVYLTEGGEDGSNGSGNTGCDPSGCRGEVVKVASVSGDTITVTTALHDTYDPSLNAAVAERMVGPVTGLTLKNITFDGNGSNVYGLELSGVAESTVTGVTAKNTQGSALLIRGNFNVSWSNINVTGAGSAQCGDAVWFEDQGNLSVNGLTVSNENPGTGSGCLDNGAFGFGMIDAANSTITNVTVNAAGAYGRPFKETASRWNTFNSLTVENGVQAYNGISLEYYSSHNTFNNCVVTNNGGGTGTATGNAGINTFGNFNQYNTFNNCTVSGNGNVQVLVNNYDALGLGQDSYVTFNGGTYTGSNTSEPVLYLTGTNAYVTSTYINGPGAQGLYLESTNACVNNNVFSAGTGLGAGISSNSSSNMGANNILNGNSSNLTAGTCTGP